MQSASVPSPGAVVAQKYRIDREIGRGGMGIVYAATDLTLGRQVALKLLLVADLRGGTGSGVSASSREDTARFMREARATASLQGEHVAQVYEAGVTHEGVPFLAMELLHGEDLDRFVARCGPLPIPLACDLLVQACAALSEAHQRGIIHRDLKPQNFFVLPPRDASGPKLKVLDFGISKMSSEADLGLTQTTMTMGSPRYMSPEQVRSSKYVDARADLWALGTVLFEALTARPLFNENTASALHAQIIADQAIPLRNVRVDAPAELEQVVFRCVEKDPSRRFASAVELAQALAPFAGPQGRAVAARLLAQFGLPMPPSVENAAVPYAAGTPGYAPTGHRLTTGAHTAPVPVKRGGSLVWLWVGLGVFAVLCIGGAAISGIFFGTLAQQPYTPTTERPEDEAPTPAPPTPATPAIPPSATPVVTPAPSDTGGRKPRPQGGPTAAEQEAAARKVMMEDQSQARTIYEMAQFQGAKPACSINQSTVYNKRYPQRGEAVAASIDICRQAGDTFAVERIQNAQRQRDAEARSF